MKPETEAQAQANEYGFIFNLAAVVNELQSAKQEKEIETVKASGESDEMQELDGWKISPMQCALISRGDREAVDKFFEQNEERLRRSIFCFLRANRYLPDFLHASWLSLEDCYNQAYLDMRQGYLFFEMKPRYISKLLWHSFRYAPVGGFGDEDGQYRYRPR